MKLQILLEAVAAKKKYTDASVKYIQEWLKHEGVKQDIIDSLSDVDKTDITRIRFLNDVAALLSKASKKRNRGPKISLNRGIVKSAMENEVKPSLKNLSKTSLKFLGLTINSEPYMGSKIYGNKSDYSKSGDNRSVVNRFVKYVRTGNKEKAQEMIDNGLPMSKTVLWQLILGADPEYTIKILETFKSLKLPKIDIKDARPLFDNLFYWVELDDFSTIITLISLTKSILHLPDNYNWGQYFKKDDDSRLLGLVGFLDRYHWISSETKKEILSRLMDKLVGFVRRSKTKKFEKTNALNYITWLKEQKTVDDKLFNEMISTGSNLAQKQVLEFIEKNKNKLI